MLSWLFSWRPVDAANLDKTRQPEGFFTLASLILSVVGAGIAGWSLFSQTLPAVFILIKDIVFFGTLLILVLYFFVRYRHAANEVERQRKAYELQIEEIRELLNQQIETYQRLMSHTRESFYERVSASIYQHRFKYVTPGLTELLQGSLDRVLTAIRRILESHFRSRNLPERVGLSLSVKALVTGRMVSELCTLNESHHNVLAPDEHYIITLDRDHDTKLNMQEREVLKAFYEISQNTDFSRIISNEMEDFQSNNLKALEEGGEYRNNSPDWHRFYNATQVVPIWHRHAGSSHIFGFLTADSLNKGGDALFDRKATKQIMMFGADLLALLFLALEMYDRLRNEKGYAA